VLFALIPRTRDEAQTSAKGGVLSTYKVVFTNPQSYLCGLVAGLLFVPTTIGDMVWGVRFFEADKLFSYDRAVIAASMVPLGWVIGCPLLGYLADRWGRRKPALMVGATVLLLGMLQLVLAPTLLPAWMTLLVMGIASGAAMIPYTIIKEVNPDEVKGSAVGGINFLTFAVTAAIGPFFAGRFGSSLGSATADPAAHFRSAGFFWVIVIAAALVVSVFLRETGKGRQPAPPASLARRAQRQ
jgi:MFS family permease